MLAYGVRLKTQTLNENTNKYQLQKKNIKNIHRENDNFYDKRNYKQLAKKFYKFNSTKYVIYLLYKIYWSKILFFKSVCLFKMSVLNL